MGRETNKNNRLFAKENVLLSVSFVLSIGTGYIDSGLYNRSAIVFMVLMMVWSFMRRPKFIISKRFFFVICAVIAILAYNYLLSPLATQKLLVYVSCFMMGVIFYAENNEDRLSKLLVIYSVILSITGFYGVIESFAGNILDAYAVKIYSSTYRLHSVFLHPIIFSLMMLQSFVINHYLVENRVLKAVLEIINVYCILMSLSRSSWLVLVAVVALMILQQRYTQKRSVLPLKRVSRRRIFDGIIVLIILIIIVQRLDVMEYINSLILRWEALGGSNSVFYRGDVISAVINDRLSDSNLIHWIIGSGFHSVQNIVGNAGLYFDTAGNNVVDNEWLSIFIDFGLFGLFVMLHFAYKSLRSFFDSEKNIEIWIVSLCVVANMLMALISDTFGWAPVGNLIFVFWGIIFAGRGYSRN